MGLGSELGLATDLTIFGAGAVFRDPRLMWRYCDLSMVSEQAVGLLNNWEFK